MCHFFPSMIESKSENCFQTKARTGTDCNWTKYNSLFERNAKIPILYNFSSKVDSFEFQIRLTKWSSIDAECLYHAEL